MILLALFHNATRELLAFAAVGIALCSLDDLFVDAVFLVRLGWRRATVYRRNLRASADSLDPAAPGRFAIIVPAWDEAAVIGAMLRDLTARLDHPAYRVFVGVYPNDPTTAAAVAGVGDPRIEIITCARSGPTTKADCLNHLWRALLADEGRHGRFKAVVLHDAEDVVDALELRVFDHLIPRLGMVQLPVVPLVDARSRWIAGHYMDEFAENHLKDMAVREALGAAVPSAGVACAIERTMLGRIADQAGGEPFDAACLTEDYELGLKIKALGGRGALVRIKGRTGVVATREHFPGDLESALRQKSRWLLGIALGGWDRLGWRSGWADRLMLMRDRKAIVSALLTVIGYVAGLFALIDVALVGAVSGTKGFAPLVAPGSWLATVLAFTSIVLGWRLTMRAVLSGHVNGWREGLRSVPRVVVGNMINALAALRATRRYVSMRRGRSTLVWDKTAHRFPGVP
ncbi:glycosyl transferase family protein [Glacieibacterium frigidum]|uniref:glycosyl transferase family protein n=1 Tax=Glacieibacterium frigidum TaxID=2593303 RepID=UPI001F158EF1|nr:glycosyl transferase family protein [Glacieibacterium frigidum]